MSNCWLYKKQTHHHSSAFAKSSCSSRNLFQYRDYHLYSIHLRKDLMTPIFFAAYAPAVLHICAPNILTNEGESRLSLHINVKHFLLTDLKYFSLIPILLYAFLSWNFDLHNLTGRYVVVLVSKINILLSNITFITHQIAPTQWTKTVNYTI